MLKYQSSKTTRRWIQKDTRAEGEIGRMEDTIVNFVKVKGLVVGLGGKSLEDFKNLIKVVSKKQQKELLIQTWE